MLSSTSKALLAALCCAVVLPLPALAVGGPGDLVLEDVAQDANGLNDQGSERVVGDVSTPGMSSAEADLLRVRLSALREGGRTTGWSVAFRVAGDVGPQAATGEQLEYGLVAQPTPDCRFSVTFTTSGAGRGTAAFSDSGGCGPGSRVELPSRLDGSVVRVDLPYRLLPRGVQPGARLGDVQAWTRLSPQGMHGFGELDNVRARGDYRLPAGGRAAAPVTQQVDGSVAVVYGNLLSLGPQVVVDAQSATHRYANGHMTYGFDLDVRTLGGRFSLGERRDPVSPSTTSQDTYGVVFLDRPLGHAGARVVAHVDDHHGDGVETGGVPAAARSAYVYAHHGLNKSFRYTATR